MRKPSRFGLGDPRGMNLRTHHIEMCVGDPERILKVLTDQFGFNLRATRRTDLCDQFLVQLQATVFLITKRKRPRRGDEDPFATFCCPDTPATFPHVDSVFNVALELDNLPKVMADLGQDVVVRTPLTRLDSPHGPITFAVVESCCGNVVHTLLDKTAYSGWFLPGFAQLPETKETLAAEAHFDHVALACRLGETRKIIEWYERVFHMKRFITNRQETESEGLVIAADVGMRLKVMEFWLCSETGLASSSTKDPLKIVVVESLAEIKNTQIESFVREHGGPGLQHIGLHSNSILETVRLMASRGVSFRQPPPTYYTSIGQLDAIVECGEDPAKLATFGILLDSEADVFEELDPGNETRYLMQIFTFPLFDLDTFFMEVIERKGARGFGVGNVTALARSVNAYNHTFKPTLKS